MKVTVMGKKYSWYVGVLVMRILALDQRAARKVVSDLKEPRN
jgi:hypothetical protein